MYDGLLLGSGFDGVIKVVGFDGVIKVDDLHALSDVFGFGSPIFSFWERKYNQKIWHQNIFLQ